MEPNNSGPGRSVNQCIGPYLRRLAAINKREFEMQCKSKEEHHTLVRCEWLRPNEDKKLLKQRLLNTHPTYRYLERLELPTTEIGYLTVLEGTGRVRLKGDIRFVIYEDRCGEEYEIIVEELRRGKFICIHDCFPFDEKQIKEFRKGNWYLAERYMIPKRIQVVLKNINPDISEVILGIKKLNMTHSYKSRGYFENFELNQSQLKAADAALSNPLSLIRGPPGTGKTTVICYIVKELLQKLHYSNKSSNKIQDAIVISADSNKAVLRISDALAKHEIEFAHLINNDARINPRSRISDETLKYLYTPEEVKFSPVRPREEKKVPWESARVICCTTMTALKLHTIHKNNMKKFIYTIIDEACQVAEDRIYNAISYECQKLILVGDEKQLSPVIMDKENIENGYGSLFERLAKDYPAQILQLNLQFRMHPELAKIFSTLFYNGSVKSDNSCNLKRMHDSIRWLFPNPEIPLMFVNVVAHENKFKGSLYNKAEVEIIIKYLHKFKEAGIAASKIGIIATYGEQVNYLQKKIDEDDELNDNNYSSRILINTVDAFQGSEIEYILLSLVRSNTGGNIGFMKDLKRLNVSISRQKLGLIIFGNKSTFMGHTGWDKLLKMVANYTVEAANGFV